MLNAPKQPFYYNSRKLLEYLRLEKEKITLEFDKFGLLVVRSGSTRYVQSPMRALFRRLKPARRRKKRRRSMPI